MLSLTINTSSSYGSLVLGSDSQVLHELQWHKEKSHSEKITLQLQELLKRSGHSLADIELLICGHGPGSFTGLRVGLSVAKTLSYAFQTPLIAVDDCFALALNALDLNPTLPICVMIDAQKNKVFAGIYESSGDALKTILKPTLLGFSELDQLLEAKKYLCIGDGFVSYNAFFPATLAQKLERADLALDIPSSLSIFKYVIRHLSEFQKISWKELSALYLRASSAEEVLADKLSKKK